MEQLPDNPTELLEHILDHSWMLFKSRFLMNRHPVLIEASFQHHFAKILSDYGNLCCSHRDDQFLVDLEVRRNDGKKDKLIDLTCSFPNRKIKCAVELKFKTKKQAAQDHGRIDAYNDIGSLERACEDGYEFGRFYMITDSSIYTHISKSPTTVATTFCMGNGHVTTAGATYQRRDSKGRENVSVMLKNSYRFEWETISKWHFLEMRVNKQNAPMIKK